ncbi:MAG: hypothetical protein GF400_06755 [Candidatus Eisenbacteria bacterium]|nr:hypothetical protein [Candidatus Eisenbacteria bacterium]
MAFRTRSLGVASAIALLALLLSGCSSSSTSPEEPDEVEADLAVSPETGTVITDFTLDAGGSTVGNRSLQYRWDWEDDGVWDTGWSNEASTTRRFDTAETVNVAVEVTDGNDTDSATGQLTLDLNHGSVAESFMCPAPSLGALGYDGEYLWGTRWLPGRLYRIDPATGDTVDSMDAPSSWPAEVTWDGTHLWVADNSGGNADCDMYKVDRATGDVLSSFTIQYSSVGGGLAWDGEYLYHGCVDDAMIYTYERNGTPGPVLQSPVPGIHTEGLGFDGEHLWASVATRDTLYVVDVPSWEVVRRIHVAYYNRGVAPDGSHIWGYVAGGSYNLARLVL